MRLITTKRAPVLRFKDEQGEEYPEWGKISLEEVLQYQQPMGYIVSNTDYSDEYQIPVLTAGKTFVLGYTNDTEGLFVDNLPVILFDDFTTAIKFVDFPFKVKSSAVKILLPNSEGTSMSFVYEAMKRIRFPLGEHKRYWISEFQKENISYPCQEEQQKIANFLSSVDTRIEQLEKKKSLLEQFKKGLMQKLFSQEIRFKDDQGEEYPVWDVKEFFTLVDKVTDSYHPSENEVIQYIGLENLESDTGILLGTSTTVNQSVKMKFLSGDVLFGKLRPYLRKFYFARFNGVCTPQIWVFRPKTIVSQYLYFAVQSHQFFRVANIQYGTKMPSSDWWMVSRSIIELPSNQLEQQKIAEILSAIDYRKKLIGHQL